MKRFVLLCALFVICSSAAFAQEDKITQGVVTQTTNTTYTTVTRTKQVRMSDEEWAEYKRQQKLKRQTYRDSMALERQAYRDSMALINAERYKLDSAKRAENVALARERDAAVRGWKNYININVSGAQSKVNYGVGSPSIGIEYIGGKRFNRAIFLGFGSGVVLNTHRNGGKWVNGKNYSYLDYNQSAKSLGLCAVSIPLYANFRLYMSSRKCQPYISLSTGFRFSGNKREQVSAHSVLSPSDRDEYKDSTYEVKYGTTQYFLSPGFGLDFVGKSGKGVSLQASFFAITMPWMSVENDGDYLSAIKVKHSFEPGYHIQLGFIF